MYADNQIQLNIGRVTWARNKIDAGRHMSGFLINLPHFHCSLRHPWNKAALRNQHNRCCRQKANRSSLIFIAKQNNCTRFSKNSGAQIFKAWSPFLVLTAIISIWGIPTAKLTLTGHYESANTFLKPLTLLDPS